MISFVSHDRGVLTVVGLALRGSSCSIIRKEALSLFSYNGKSYKFYALVHLIPSMMSCAL